VPLIIWSPKRFAPRRIAEPETLCDLLPTFADLCTDGKAILARKVDGRSLYPLLSGASETPDATAWGEYLAEGVIAPMYMLRRGSWKFIHTPTDPDQLFDLAADPDERRNLAAYADHEPRARSFRREIEQKFDIARITDEVMASQQARLMMFEALRRGAHFPWDFQPLREASEQYTRNHMSVTDRDLKSRFPPAPDVADKRR
jgi:choline-sulfatase